MKTDHPKPRACKHCQSQFTPARPLQVVCSPICAMRMTRVTKAKEKAQLRERKAALKRIPDLIAEAQKAFNAYIRERDRGQPCICCGRATTNVDGLRSHGWDAGHYRSTGSASHLRFNEDNVHRQLVYCNRDGAGRAVDYRLGLLQRIGESRVAALESNNTPHKWTREELIEIKKTYQAKLKALKA